MLLFKREVDSAQSLSFIAARFCLGYVLSVRSVEEPCKGIGIIVVDVQKDKKPLDTIDIGGG
ncbi:MAG: hypothetical protein AB7Y74_02750 [Syntrophorhabdus sp.]